MTIGLATNLQTSTRYTVTMDSGAIADLAGNAYDGITDSDTWNFTTEADALALYTFADGTANSSDSDAGTTANPAVFGADVAGDAAEISSDSANGLSWGNPDNALYIESIDTIGDTARGNPGNAPGESTIAKATNKASYVAFTVTPGAGYEMTLTGLRLDYAVNGGFPGWTPLPRYGRV